MQFTEESALYLNGINTRDMSDDARTDAARAAGAVELCLGCACLVAIVPCESESQRVKLAAVIEVDCCPAADSIRY